MTVSRETWRQRCRYVLERSDGARVVRCWVEPYGWRYAAWPSEPARLGLRGPIWEPIGYFETCEAAKRALD